MQFGDGRVRYNVKKSSDNGDETEEPAAAGNETDATADAEDREKLIAVEIDENGVATDYEVALKHIGLGLFHVLIMVVNGLALSSDAIEVLSISFVLTSAKSPSELNMADWQSALLSSIIFAGMLIGSYLWGTMSDISGRRMTLMTSLTVNGVFGLVSAFAPNYWLFIFFRFASGVGVGGSLPVIFSYMSEMVRNKYRGPYLGVLSMHWMLGSLLCGAFAWMIVPAEINLSLGSLQIHSWRVFIIVSSIPSILGACLYFFLPESPRFLLEVGKQEQAMKGLRLAYRLNHIHRPGKEFPIKSIDIRVTPKNQATDQPSSIRLWIVKKLHDFKVGMGHVAELFNRVLLLRTLLLLGVHFCLSFGGYGVSLWYPTYVEQINERADVDRFYGASCNNTISDLILGSEELTRLRRCSSTSFKNVTFDHITFTDWTFADSLLERSIFDSCVFNDVTFQRVNTTSALFVNGSGTAVLFDTTVLHSTGFCGLNVSNFTMVGSLVTDVTVNGRPVSNQTSLLEALREGFPPPSPCSAPSVGSPYTTKVDKYQVYEESFYIAGSALPGNILSAFAVYFLRRNYWLAFSLFASTCSAFLLYVVTTPVFVVTVLCLFNAISTPAWNDGSLLIAELYPTHLRSTALGIHFIMIRIGAILGTNVFGHFIAVNPSVPILLVAVILLVGSVLALPLPKTTRHTILN
eukprot:Em0006g1043a